MAPDRLRKLQGQRLAEAREKAGYRSARDAAMSNGWPESSYRAHENGTRTIGLDDAERYARRFRLAGAAATAQSILFGADEEPAVISDHTIKIMGRIGAGAEIEPDYEQVPGEGIEQVELPYPIDQSLVGFRVVGDSMSPAYEEDAVIVVDGDQPIATEGMIGMAAAVLCVDADGERRRYLKRIRRGSRPGRFSLESVNDRSPLIRDAEVVWASPVRMIIPNIGLRRVPGSKALARKAPTRRSKIR